MGKIKNFEDFNEGVRKFFTGYNTSEDKEKAKEKILSDITKKVTDMVELGNLDKEKANVKIESLTKQAEDDNWKGKILIRKSPRGGIFVVYEKGDSPFQSLSKSAHAAT